MGGAAGAAFAVVQHWPQPRALRELAALHLIKFPTRHSPSLAPGTAGSAKTPRDGPALWVKEEIPGAGGVRGIPPQAAVLGERRKSVLGKTTSLSLAPLTRPGERALTCLDAWSCLGLSHFPVLGTWGSGWLEHRVVQICFFMSALCI